MPTYDQRHCIECGKDFTPIYASQVTCGPECRAERIHRFNIEYGIVRRRKHREYVASLEAKVKELEAQLEKAHAANTEQIMPLREELAATRGECERLKDELAKVKAELEALRKAEAKGKEATLSDAHVQKFVTPEAIPTPEPPAQESAKKLIPCKYCGKMFTPKYPWAVYCSKECSHAAKKEQVYNYNKAHKAKKTTQTLPADIADKMNVCDRLKLKSMSPLPCGTRYECEGCEKCPEGAKPVPRFNSVYEQTEAAI